MGVVSSTINRNRSEWCLQQGPDEPGCKAYFQDDPVNDIISYIIVFVGLTFILIFYQKDIKRMFFDRFKK